MLLLKRPYHRESLILSLPHLVLQQELNSTWKSPESALLEGVFLEDAGSCDA